MSKATRCQKRSCAQFVNTKQVQVLSLHRINSVQPSKDKLLAENRSGACLAGQCSTSEGKHGRRQQLRRDFGPVQVHCSKCVLWFRDLTGTTNVDNAPAAMAVPGPGPAEGAGIRPKGPAVGLKNPKKDLY